MYLVLSFLMFDGRFLGRWRWMGSKRDDSNTKSKGQKQDHDKERCNKFVDEVSFFCFLEIHLFFFFVCDFLDNRHNGNLEQALEELENQQKNKKTWKPGLKAISAKKDDKDEKVNYKPTQEREEKAQIPSNKQTWR